MTTLTRPSLADIEAAFEALDPRDQIGLLDKLAETAGMDLELESLALQAAENSAGPFIFERQDEVDRLLWAHRPEPYHQMRDKYLAYAFRDKGEGM